MKLPEKGAPASEQVVLSLDPEAVNVLGDLRSRYALGLVSNFDHPKHLYEILDQHELTQFFDAIVISGEVGVKKPDPSIMFLAPHENTL